MQPRYASKHGTVKIRSYAGDPTKTFGKGRICAVPDCNVRLSMYNPGQVCSDHTHYFEEGILSSAKVNARSR